MNFPNIANNIANLFSRATRNPATDRQRTLNERLQQYARYLRAYQGYSVRGILNTNVVRDWKRIKFNFVQPVVNLSAGWFAAKPIDWEIKNEPEATAAAYAIWARSGSDAALLENAICCGIYGEIVGLATQDTDGKAKIEFVDPSIATPVFDGSDYSHLSSLEIAYEQFDAQGQLLLRREMWFANGMETYENDKRVDSRSYEALPAVWIRNSSVKGVPFGMSDVEPIIELVEEYDHIASKQTRILDYYAAPNVVFSGLQKGETKADKQVGTAFYLPADAKAYFLEWAGSGPPVEEQLTRVRNAIAEISQVPAVAFGQADSGLTAISGVAIQILYGPLLSKTHRKQAQWGPSLQYLMWLCLRASGYKDLPLEAVNVKFPNATPVDGAAMVLEAVNKVSAQVSSRRTVMNDLGIQNPDAELKRIIIEEKILQLAAPVPPPQAPTGPASGSDGSSAPPAAPAPPPKVADATGTNDEDIAHLIERLDALLEMESESIAESEDAPKEESE